MAQTINSAQLNSVISKQTIKMDKTGDTNTRKIKIICKHLHFGRIETGNCYGTMLFIQLS